MTLNDIFTFGGGWLLIIMTMVEIIPLRINPWTWLGKRIGKAINGEVVEKVDRLSREVDQMKADAEKREADQCRVRILRFNDELVHSKEIRHTKEHFEQTLNDVAIYEAYCAGHAHYKNHIADDAIRRIKKVYQKCGDNDSFL